MIANGDDNKAISPGNANGTMLAQLRQEVETALADAVGVDEFNSLGPRVRRLIEDLGDVADRLSAIKLAGQLCWNSPVSDSKELRRFALEELVKLCPNSLRARAILVQQFLPPLHAVSIADQPAMLAAFDTEIDRISKTTDHSTTRTDLLFLKCLARIEAARAWSLPWLDAHERRRVDAWLDDLERSAETAPSGEPYAKLILVLRRELAASAVPISLADVTARDLNDQSVSFSAFLGKPVVLSFWATWCVPCLELLPHEAEMAKRFGDRAVLIGVNTDPTAEQARRTVASFQIDWLQIWAPPDAPNSLIDKLSVRQWPSVVIVGLDGRVIARFAGSAYQRSWSMADVERVVEKMLGNQ